MTRATVRISVVDGVAYVNEVPAGVTVEITDYDVAVATQRDEDGRPCARYYVRPADIPPAKPISKDY